MRPAGTPSRPAGCSLMDELQIPAVDNTIIEATSLKKYYPLGNESFFKPKSLVHAVDDIDFVIQNGETLGLVGESGSGKTTVGRLLVKLVDPDSGRIYFRQGENVVDVGRLAKNRVKGFRRQVQMIFQDPYESLNPRRTVFDTIVEPLSVQGLGTSRSRDEQVTEILTHVGLTPAHSFKFRYPHELSGGQRQRVAIARALVLRPSFVVADEPTSMLDVSVRVGIIDLMSRLGEHFRISYLYITHDLAVARYICHRIAVMYMGKIVEVGETEEVLQHPQHPYTRALISAVPELRFPTQQDGDSKSAGILTGLGSLDIREGTASAVNPVSRCRFYDRCPIATEECRLSDHPPLEDKGSGHMAACYRV